MQLKRKFDNLMAEGKGRQLLWLMVIAIICLAVALVIAHFVFSDGTMTWQDIVGLLLDAGNFQGPGQHDWFRLSIALISTFLFSALLVSMFTNVFDNISESVRNGERRYHANGHVLILGSGHQLGGMLAKLARSGKTVIVMSEEKPVVVGDYIYYQGSRDSEQDLKSARPSQAETIYIIGNDNEKNHDARNICSLELLQSLCKEAQREIHCYIIVNDHLTTEVFQYSKQKPGAQKLLVDVINDNEYQAEQLLVDTPFLPRLRQGDSRLAQIVILGTNSIAQAVADTAAHLCHYPNFIEQGKRTVITFIGEGMEPFRNRLLAARPALFAMSHHTFFPADGLAEVHTPEPLPHLAGQSSDFLDVEWHFVDSADDAPLARRVLTEVAADQYATCVIVCHEESGKATESALHLPRVIYDKAAIAVYMNEKTDLLQRANGTGMYGTLTLFGPAGDTNLDPLFTQRSDRGQRVNYSYCKAYGSGNLGSAVAEWFKISEADKYSSIYCANAMFLRMDCYPISSSDDSVLMPIYEAEHRRWMMSELLMGFASGEKTDKKRFIHADIVPFDCLTPEEQHKDKILIDNMKYIMG